MPSKRKITHARLCELLRYDQRSGLFIRLVAVNTRVDQGAGSIAGCIRPDDYVTVWIDGRGYQAHILAWFYMTKRWPKRMPKHEIDHISRVRHDNRWANLRQVTRSENQQNHGAERPKTISGLLGAHFHVQTGRWAANIKLHGKSIFLGLHDSAQMAHAAYLAKKREIHPRGTL